MREIMQFLWLQFDIKICENKLRGFLFKLKVLRDFFMALDEVTEWKKISFINF